MMLHVQENICWVCGKESVNLTSHHTIPQHLKPIKNMVIPVCKDCHKKINSDDISGMYSFIYKIERSITGAKNQINSLNKLVGENIALQKIMGEKIKIKHKVKNG